MRRCQTYAAPAGIVPAPPRLSPQHQRQQKGGEYAKDHCLRCRQVPLHAQPKLIHHSANENAQLPAGRIANRIR